MHLGLILPALHFFLASSLAQSHNVIPLWKAFFMSKTGKGRLFCLCGTYIYLFIPFNVIMLCIQSSHNRLWKAWMAVAFYDPFRSEDWKNVSLLCQVGSSWWGRHRHVSVTFLLFFLCVFGLVFSKLLHVATITSPCLLMLELRFSHSTHPSHHFLQTAEIFFFL